MFSHLQIDCLLRKHGLDLYNVGIPSWFGSHSQGSISKRTIFVNTSHARVNSPLFGQSASVNFPGFCSKFSYIRMNGHQVRGIIVAFLVTAVILLYYLSRNQNLGGTTFMPCAYCGVEQIEDILKGIGEL